MKFLSDELSNKYKYKKLSNELSNIVRNIYANTIPAFLLSYDKTKPLYSLNGSLICNGYDRIVIGDYGAFIEFDDSMIIPNQFIIAPGQEYRVYDERYSRNVKYIWLTINDGSNIKIYLQKRGVSYADYKPGK